MRTGEELSTPVVSLGPQVGLYRSLLVHTRGQTTRGMRDEIRAAREEKESTTYTSFSR